MPGHPEKTLRVHLALVVGEIVCASAFVVELHRALSGNTLSWAYVFEWPILGAYAVYVWWKLRRPEVASDPAPASDTQARALAEYNRYLAEVHHDRGASDQ